MEGWFCDSMLTGRRYARIAPVSPMGKPMLCRMSM